MIPSNSMQRKKCRKRNTNKKKSRSKNNLLTKSETHKSIRQKRRINYMSLAGKWNATGATAINSKIAAHI